MKHRLMDLLACPIDKSWPLKLEISKETKEVDTISLPLENPNTGVVCGFYCNFKQYSLVIVNDADEEENKSIKEIEENVKLEDCQECFQINIQGGKLFCKIDESHEYEIKEGIPVMLSKEKIEEIYGKKRVKTRKNNLH